MSIYRGAGGASDSVDDATVNAVAAYAADAASSATSAAASATTAATAASSTSGSVSAVATSASNAATSATNASTSASNAATSATSAANSSTSATASALAASVSSFESAASAASANTSKVNADTSATNAATSATNSANSAASALAIYGNTTAMNNAVSAASTSATNASTSASNAATSASTATTQATNAANSATAADSSKSLAFVYASNASVSAYNAAVSATASATSATNSAAVYGGLSAVNTAVATTTTNSNNAATSASNAATSATQAAASAASASAIVLGTASSLPSIRPTLNLDFANSSVIDPRITFSRASTATYYDGKTTAKAEENLFTYSQEFDNAAWTKSNTTVTANVTTAPDGTTTAELLAEAATTTDHLLITNTANRFSATNGNNYIGSVFIKKGSGATAPDWVQLVFLDYFPVTTYANFNISTGVVGNKAAGVTATITSFGNGWYRCSISAVATSSGTLARWLVAFTNNADTTTNFPTYAGVTTSDVYIWGAQLEQRSSVTAYTPTTTQAITNYIPVLQTAASGVARLDYDPVTFAAKGLLIEEARTNLLTYSSEFDNASWVVTASTVVANVLAAPDGAITADKLVESTATSQHYILKSTTTTAQSYTWSVYLKAAGRSWARLQVDNPVYNANFDLVNGVVGTTNGTGTAQITPVGSGWFRCSISFTGVVATPAVYINAAVSNTVLSYAGDGTSGIYIWGAQLEAGAFATSYIPTTTAQATRAADSASMTGTNFSSWFNASEGTLDVKYNIDRVFPSTTYPRILSINDTTTTNLIDIFINGFYPKTAGLIAANGTQMDVLVGSNLTSSTVENTSLAYKLNDSVFTKNGLAVISDTSCVMPMSLSRLQIGSSPESRYINGTIISILYYPKRITNTELQALTA